MKYVGYLTNGWLLNRCSDFQIGKVNPRKVDDLLYLLQKPVVYCGSLIDSAYVEMREINDRAVMLRGSVK